MRPLPLLALLLVSGPALSATRGAVAVDLRKLSDEAYRRLAGAELEKQLVIRLVQEGFTVVAPGPEAALVLQLLEAEQGLRLEVSGCAQDRAVRWREASSPELRLELSHKAADLASSCAAVPAAALTPSTLISLGGGGTYRLYGLDPQVTLGVQRALTGRWAIRADLRWNRSVETPLIVDEAGLLVGAALRVVEQGAFAGQLGLRLGGWLHHYQIPSTLGPTEEGWRGFASVGVPLGIQWMPANRFGLFVEVAPGFAFPVPHHTLSGITAWRRSPFRLDAAVGLLLGI